MVVFKTNFNLNNKKDDEADLQMRVRWGSTMLVMNLGYRVNPEKWDKDIQQCRNNTFHGRKKISASIVNKDIRQYRSAVSQVADSFQDVSKMPGKDEVKDKICSILGLASSAEDSVLFTSIVVEYVTKESKLRGWSDGTISNYLLLANRIKKWKPNVTLSYFDYDGLEDFYTSLLDIKLRSNTLMSYVSHLKSVLKWADLKGGYKVNGDYRKFVPRIKKIPKTIVWLTREEVELLHHATFSCYYNREGLKEIARDIFVFSCYTGLRFSDIHNLQHSNIRDGKIHLNVKKTSVPIVIELNGTSRELLNRYKSHDQCYCFPRVKHNVIDARLRTVCMELGIDAPVNISYFKGGKRIDETKKKYELISMHTGRRTFICQALERGISPQIIMRWTGHAGYEEMRPYIDISDRAKESAMKLFEED